jgi:hypothetical protein
MEIWSGGQTGVDRAALDVALELGIPIGGWIPRGRRAEDGVIPARYAGLSETKSLNYRVRTARNVRDTDATLILSFGPPTGGTAVTVELVRRYQRPVLLLDMRQHTPSAAARKIRSWLRKLSPDARVNVAGPRGSHSRIVYDKTVRTLRRAFADSYVDHSWRDGALYNRCSAGPRTRSTAS